MARHIYYMCCNPKSLTALPNVDTPCYGKIPANAPAPGHVLHNLANPWSYQRSVAASSTAPAAQMNIMDCLIRSRVCGFLAKACCWADSKLELVRKDLEDAPPTNVLSSQMSDCQANWISSNMDQMLIEWLCHALGCATILNHANMSLSCELRAFVGLPDLASNRQ
jgi:hypothetical protein